MYEVFIGVGSNLGDRHENILSAIEFLKRHRKVTVEKISSFIETEPVGGPPQGKFLNGVIKIKTSLSPMELLKFLQDIEKRLGRERKIKWGPRTIDLDILLYDDKVIDSPDLKIPHPQMFKREFVLKPLFEIEPNIKNTIEKLKRKANY